MDNINLEFSVIKDFYKEININNENIYDILIFLNVFFIIVITYYERNFGLFYNFSYIITNLFTRIINFIFSFFSIKINFPDEIYLISNIVYSNLFLILILKIIELIIKINLNNLFYYIIYKTLLLVFFYVIFLFLFTL